MKPIEIPQSTLQEAYRAIAERRGEDDAALDKATIAETELLSAVAYVLGIPLIEPDEFEESLFQESRMLTAELEVDALLDYQFIPFCRRADTMVAISACPWDTVVTEVLLGYFRQCARVKFILASSAGLQVLINRLKSAEGGTSTAASAAGALAGSSSAGNRPFTSPLPVVLPPGARATAPATAPTTPASERLRSRRLTTEEVTALVNLLADEIRRLTEQKPRTSL